MLDWPAIYVRFAQGYDENKPARLAKIVRVTKQSAHDWKKGKSHVPWRRMKTLVDNRGLSWDRLLEGREPKFANRTISKGLEDFDWNGINQRFLELFPNQSQEEIGRQLGVTQETVSKWYRGENHVPWDKLKYAHITFSVTWEYLIEGT